MSLTKSKTFFLTWKFLCNNHVRISQRNFAMLREQDPEEIKNMHVFEFTSIPNRTKGVYMWGNAVCGALGNIAFTHPKFKKPLKEMRRPWRFYFADYHKVNDISCGYGFTVIAAQNSKADYSLFGTGLNSDYQIGYHCRRKGHPLEVVSQPVPILLPLLNSKTKAIKVACGRAHTIVVTDKEGVFSLGNNAFGQCGCPSPKIKSMEGIPKINKIEGIDQEISEVVCGQDHTMFLTSSGEVYSCGWGADGQTGLGHYNNQFIPTRIKGDIDGEKIIQLSGAADCVLAVSDKGDVFGWGNSEYAQLNSTTEEQQVNTPKHLNLKNVGKVLQVASGGTMCAVLSEKGNVYVWGYGILGQGPAVTHLTDPTMLPEPLFGLNEYNTDVKVAQIACSLSHFAAITNKGSLYMWGRNRSSCLGLGIEHDQFFPFRVCIAEQIQKVSCGVDHTAVISKTLT